MRKKKRPAATTACCNRATRVKHPWYRRVAASTPTTILAVAMMRLRIASSFLEAAAPTPRRLLSFWAGRAGACLRACIFQRFRWRNERGSLEVVPHVGVDGVDVGELDNATEGAGEGTGPKYSAKARYRAAFEGRARGWVPRPSDLQVPSHRVKAREDTHAP